MHPQLILKFAKFAGTMHCIYVYKYALIHFNLASTLKFILGKYKLSIHPSPLFTEFEETRDIYKNVSRFFSPPPLAVGLFMVHKNQMYVHI
jgi:hypothetical protein